MASPRFPCLSTLGPSLLTFVSQPQGSELTVVFGPYVWFPILTTMVWLGGILALLLLWVTAGKPRYRGDEAAVVYISDVGAVHKKVFIGISCSTAG
jgi:hypothetical protein